MKLSSKAARQFILDGREGSITVDDAIDLRGTELKSIQCKVRCHDLDASNTPLESLPHGITVRSRIVLDNCGQLHKLPRNLECGSLSLRGCGFLAALPEGLSTWFLDLTDCHRFSKWPKNATVGRGSVRLRNCIELQSLPSWLGTLGQLDLSGCVQIHQIPDGVRVTGWLDAGGTGLTSLPPSLADAPLRWRGVPIDHRIAFDPESITAKETIAESNAERRRVMIERMGYLRFADEVGAKVLDSDQDAGGPRELLHVDLEDDEPLVGLACRCPSTDRQYFLRVPPTMKSCHQAAAWMAGFDDPAKYRPVIET